MWIWSGLFLLGAYHGLNPAMGWLFAVALGLQEKNSNAVLRSLLPLGLGHLLSVGAVVAVAELVQFTLPLRTARVIAAAVLVGFGVYRLIRQRHPRWVGMQVGARDLTIWSFLMASAHGAGLMLLPFVLAVPAHTMADGQMHHHMMMASAVPASSGWWAPIAVHTTAYVLVTALLALIVYHKVGVAVLRRAWFNLDLLWVATLVLTGILTLAL